MPSAYSFHRTLSFISAFSVSIPLMIGLVNKKYFKPNSTILFYLGCVGLLTETIAVLLLKNHLHNLLVYRSFTVVQFVMLSIFFSKTLSPSKIILFIKVFVFVFLGIACIDLYVTGIETTDDLASSTASISLILYSLFTFFYIMQKPVYANILSDPLFWFNTAILVYFSGTLFLFIFNGYILKHAIKIHAELWIINSVLNIIFNLLLATGFWKTKHRQIS